MAQIELEFEEIPLVVDRQPIALISGQCDIAGSPDDWDISDIYLLPPQGGYLFEIPRHHVLRAEILNSIAAACEDRIKEDLLEAMQPDPDEAYERKREERWDDR